MKKFNHEFIRYNSVHGGDKFIFRFDNNYGASVIRNRYSYGYEDRLWELAVFLCKDNDWRICYDTPITDDVLGWLDEDDVEKVLSDIKGL